MAVGNAEVVKKLLDEKVGIDTRTDNFKTPLMRAAVSGHIECLEVLKRYGADELAGMLKEG